jgi:hypothetical protein
MKIDPHLEDSGLWILFILISGAVVLSLIYIRHLFKIYSSSPEAEKKLGRLIESLTTPSTKVKIGLILLGIGVLVLTSLIGPTHDHSAYVRHWSAILQGSDPWNLGEGTAKNAYGPLYNALALLYAINPFLPKIIFCIAWLGASCYIINTFRQKFGGKPTVTLAGVFTVFLNPFFLIMLVIYGSMDILPAVFCLGAIVFRIQRRFFLSGIALGIGILFKFYPIVLLPFLMIDERRFRFSLMSSCVGTMILGLSISVWVWGMSTFNPVLFATDRPSKMLSIFRFLRGEYSPLYFFTDNPNIDAYSFSAMVLFLFIVFYFAWSRKIETSLAAILGLLTALTFYKVGHHQFYVALFLMAPLWYTQSDLSEFYKNKVFLPMSLFLAWIAILTLVYFLTGHYKILPFLRPTIGLPTFALAVWSITAAIYYGGSRAKEK